MTVVQNHIERSSMESPCRKCPRAKEDKNKCMGDCVKIKAFQANLPGARKRAAEEGFKCLGKDCYY